MKYPAWWPMAAIGLLVAANAHAVVLVPAEASTYSFVQAQDGQFSEFTTDGTGLSQQAGGYSATAQTSFGVNHAFASATGASGVVEAASIWTDRFTVSAPVGTLVPVSIRIWLSGSNSSPVPEGESTEGGGEYDLLVHPGAMLPAELLASLDADDSQALIKVGLDHANLYSEVLTASFLAKAGDVFFVSSVLDVGASQDQVLDFSHSVRFGISVGPGVTLTSASGTVYAAAVPEPGVWTLLLAGMGVLGCRVSARQSRHESGRIRPH